MPQIAKEPMTQPKPGERVALLNRKTGQTLSAWPVDARELLSAPGTDWVRDSEATAAPAAAAPIVQTVRDLQPEPAPLPGQPKPAKGGK